MPIIPNYSKAMSFTPPPTLWKMEVSNGGVAGSNSCLMMFGGDTYNTSWPYWYPGSGNFCVETWVYMTGTNTYGTIWTMGGDNSIVSADLGICFANESPTYGADGVHWVLQGCLQGTTGGTVGTIYNSNTDPLNNNWILVNTWNHVAMTRNSNTISLWVNGTLSNTYTYSSSINNPSSTGATIDMYGVTAVSRYNAGNSGYNFSGFTRNTRYTVGNAVYTSAFTPPPINVRLFPLTGTYFNVNPVQNSGDFSYDPGNPIYIYSAMNEIPTPQYNYSISTINTTQQGDQTGYGPSFTTYY